MMQVNIKNIKLENFKGCKQREYTFGDNTKIFGANATGKTTIFDAVWWCLFNKDSLGSEKFSIRPLDTKGQPIHNLEIKVRIVLDVNGREMELCKIQKEKWVKRRGSETTELQGNENLYEIDGYPKTERDYKLAIADLVSEDVFKMLTSSTYFTSLKWKEQRDILMRFVADVNDYDLASGEERFAPLLDELMKAPSTDDIMAKLRKALTEWKHKQAEIPVRIDEAEKSKIVIDVAELELGKKAVQELIKSNRSKQEDVSKQYEEHEKLSDGILDLKFKLGDLERSANAELIAKRNILQSDCENLISSKNTAIKSIDNKKMDLQFLENSIANNQTEIAIQRDKWAEENNRVFDDSSLVCPYCKQEYPQDKKDELRADFESHKAKQLQEITERGNSLKKKIDSDKAELVEIKKAIKIEEAKLAEIEKQIEDAEKSLSEIPTSIDVSQSDEYKKIQKQIAEKEVEMQKLNSADGIKKQLAEEEEKLNEQLLDIERRIASAQKNVEIDERIAQLQAEQREVGQKVADQEKMLYLLEEFIRYKMDKVSADINSKFEGIDFKLFDMQINGGMKETCECTVDGVPYKDLNNGHRIIAGLQIIKALQGLYAVQMPVFVDNAESINDFNLPQMDCQLVLLKVSEDKELKVITEV